MSPLVNSCIAWFRRNLGWSNSRQSWQERIGTLGLVVVAAVLIWQGGRVPLPLRLVCWSLWVGAGAVLLRRGWLKLFGPILFYDLVQVGRRSRYLILRGLYALLLLLLLLYVYWMWYLYNSYRFGGDPSFNAQFKMYEFTEQYFFWFMGCQLLAVLILTPGYVAGAVADEKDRKTLEFLLATDLRDREIVLGKLVSRMGNLLLLILTGLPVLSFIQFLGGVDPDEMLAGFAATILSMGSLAGLSILCSVYSRKARDAIVLTYLIVVDYHVLSFLSLALPTTVLGMTVPEALSSLLGSIGSFLLPSSAPILANLDVHLDKLDTLFGSGLATERWTVQDLVNAFNAGNFFLVLGKIAETVARGQTLIDVLPQLLRNYAIFHGLITVGSASWGLLRLRPVALAETQDTRQASLLVRLLGRPPVGGQPMLWKEVFAEPGLRFNWLFWFIFGRLVLLSFLPVPIIIYAALDYQSRASWRRTDFMEELGQEMNVYVRMVGTLVASLMWLAVAVRSAGSLSGERDKQTLDGLLTSPLDTSSILLAKWVGNVFSVRWGWLWLGGIWLLGVVTTGMQVWCLPLLVGAWLIYAGVFSWIGLWFSLVCKTTLRATIWTLMTTLAVSVGHWLPMVLCCFMPLSFVSHGSGRDLRYLAEFQVGQTPPAVIAILSFHGREFRNNYASEEMIEFIGFSLLGMGTWLVAGLVLGTITTARFQAMTGRDGNWFREHQPATNPFDFEVVQGIGPPEKKAETTNEAGT